MKYIKTFEGKKFFNTYYKLIKDLDIGDYIVIDSPNNSFFYNIYKNKIGEIVDMTDSNAYVLFLDTNNTIWVKKEYIVKHSKLRKDIEEFIEAKNDGEKYNL